MNQRIKVSDWVSEQKYNLFLSLIPLQIFLISWLVNIPNFDSIGRVPYKDASAWQMCSKSLAEFGKFPDGPGNWCLRRPLFSEVSAAILHIFKDIFFVYLFFTIFFCICLYILNLATINYGKYFRFSLNLTILGFWLLFGNYLFLSESFAISFGIIIAHSFIRYRDNQNIQNLFLLSLYISVLLAIRPSNLFLAFLPFMLLIKDRLFTILNFCILTSLTLVGPMTNRLLGVIFKIEGYGNSGNSWATLNDIATTNTGWSNSYSQISGENLSDFEVSKEIKKLAIQNIFQNPFVTIKNISNNFINLLYSNHLFLLPSNFSIPVFGQIFSILFSILIFYCLLKNRNQKYFVIVSLFILSQYGFYAIFWNSEPSRVLSSTIPLSIILLFDYLNANSKNPFREKHKFRVNNKKIIYGITSSIFIIFVIPILNHKIFIKPLTPTFKCNTSEFEILKSSSVSQDLSDVKKLGLFEWETAVKNLSQGYIHNVLALHNSEVYALRLYSNNSNLPICISNKNLVSNSDKNLKQLNYLLVR